MPLLRKIELRKWVDAPRPWLRAGQFTADVLGDLASDDGKLSFWRVGDGCDRDRITAALAANRNKVGKLDYLLIDDAALPPAVFRLEKSRGQSPDPELNGNCHVDVIELTEESMLRLSRVLRAAGDFQICTFPTLADQIAAAVRSGWIKPKGVKPAVAEELVARSVLTAAELQME